jgi:hypothetical protein
MVFVTPYCLEGSTDHFATLESQVVVANDCIRGGPLEDNGSRYSGIASAVVCETALGAIPQARLTDVGADDDGHRGGYLSTSRKSDIGDKMLGVAADIARRQTDCDQRLIYRTTAAEQLPVRKSWRSDCLSR